MNSPLFSVIIPTFNRAEKLQRALESLVAQSCRDFEVLVCDDGSTDATGEIVKDFATRLPIRYLWEENSGGPARPRNRGIAAATGSWLCFLDADDWWHPEKLATVREVTDRADFIYHASDVQTKQGLRPVGKHSRQLVPPVFVDLMTKGCSLVTSSVCVRKEVLASVGGFSEEPSLVAIEDFELWLRISRVTEKFLYLPVCLASYWMDDANISSYSARYIAREQAVVERYARYLDQADREEAERLLAYKTGVARKYLGDFSGCKADFRKAMGSRNVKIRLYAAFYTVLALLRSRYTIP